MKKSFVFVFILVSEEKKLEDAALSASTRLKEVLQKERHKKTELQKNFASLQVMAFGLRSELHDTGLLPERHQLKTLPSLTWSYNFS